MRTGGDADGWWMDWGLRCGVRHEWLSASERQSEEVDEAHEIYCWLAWLVIEDCVHTAMMKAERPRPINYDTVECQSLKLNAHRQNLPLDLVSQALLVPIMFILQH